MIIFDELRLTDRPLCYLIIHSQIQIFHRVSWRRSRDQNSACKPDEGTLLNGQGSLECRSGCLGTVGDMSFHCTDFSILEDWVTGTRAYNYTLPASTSSFEAS